MKTLAVLLAGAVAVVSASNNAAQCDAATENNTKESPRFNRE